MQPGKNQSRQVGKNQKNTDDAHPSHESPQRMGARAARQKPESFDGRGASAAPQGDFRHQQREADGQHAQQVNNQKRAAAVLEHQPGKLPEIVKPDGRAAGRQHKHQG